MASPQAPEDGAQAREAVSGNVPGDRVNTATRPARLRVTRPDVEEVLRSPRRGRPKKLQAPPQDAAAAEGGERPRFGCAFQEEGERAFAPPELVWGKVRSHPWWPGQVFDAADASELALQHRRLGASLVAYFWDKTFAWRDASTLRPFRDGFEQLAGQSTMASFMSAVDTALGEVTRRVEVGLTCGCFSNGIVKKQEFENAGVREGAYGAVVDAAFMRDKFRGEAILQYISELGREPLAGADRLDLTIAKAQLRAFNRLRGPRDLPEFVMFEGIDDVAEVMPIVKKNNLEKGDGNGVSGKEKLGRGKSKPQKEEIALGRGENLEEDANFDAAMDKGVDVALSKRKKASCGESLVHKQGGILEAANEMAMDKSAGMPIGDSTDNALSKLRKSRRRGNSAHKKEHISEDAKGLEKVGVGEMPIVGAVDNGLSTEKKSGHGKRSRRKNTDVSEDAKKMEKDDGDEISTGKETTDIFSNKRSRGRVRSAYRKENIPEDGEGCGEDGGAPVTLSGSEKKSRRREILSTKKVLIPKEASGGSKARGKRSSHASVEKLEDPYLYLKDPAKNRKRKKLDALGDFGPKSQPQSRKKFTKIGELISRAAGQMSQTASVLKSNGAAAQASSHGAKHRRGIIADESPSSLKAEREKKDSLQNSPSCVEMLSQLCLAARDLKKRDTFAPTIISFFTDFRNSLASSSLDDDEVPEKADNMESAPLEPPAADHMQDSYWADMLVNEDPEGEPLSCLRKKKAKGNRRTNKRANQVKERAKESSASQENGEPRPATKQGSENGMQLKAEIKPCSGNGAQLKAEAKSSEEMEGALLAGLVLNFSRPTAVPSGSDLIKIFSRYGPVKEAKTEIASNANRAQVVFKRQKDAEAAFAGAGKISALGPALISFRLTYLPSAAPNDPPKGTLKIDKVSPSVESVSS